MADDTERLLTGLDGPRPLTPELRERLAEQLLAQATPMPLGDELDQRLESTLADPTAAVLAGIDGPRPLSPALRARLEGRLSGRAVRHRLLAVRIVGAAAAVVLVATLAVIALGGGGGSQRGRTLGSSAANEPLAGGSSDSLNANEQGTDASGTTAAAGAQRSAFPVPAATSAAPAFATDGRDTGLSAHQGPRVDSVTPSSGPSTGGTWVTIRGADLERVTQVSFGRDVAQQVQVVSDSELRALAPSRQPGTVDVVVTTSSGSSARSASDLYTYRS